MCYITSMLCISVSGSIITESIDDWCFHLHHLIACLVFWLRGVQWVYFGEMYCLDQPHSNGVRLIGSRYHHFLLLHCFGLFVP